MMRALSFALLFLFSVGGYASSKYCDVRDDLHFPLHARATNKDGSTPVYKNAHASIEERVDDLLPRMTLEEKVAQLCVIYSYTHPSAHADMLWNRHISAFRAI